MKSIKTLFTFVVGAAAGAAVALVLAPETGKDTRKRIKTVSDEAIEKMKETLRKHGIELPDEAAEDIAENIAEDLANPDTYGSE